MAASIRDSFPEETKMIAYCRNERLDALDDNVIEALRRMRCEVEGFDVGDREANFDSDYDALIAAKKKRDTTHSLYLSRDMMFFQKVSLDTFTHPNGVVAPEKSKIPEEIAAFRGMSFKGLGANGHIDLSTPLTGTGIVAFPEQPKIKNGKRFSEIWASVAYSMRLHPQIDKLTEYVDRIALQVAINLHDMEWVRLPQSHNVDLTKVPDQGRALDRDNTVATRYVNWNLLNTSGLSEHGYRCLKRQAGTRRLNLIWDAPDPNADPDAPMPLRKDARKYLPVPPASDGIAPLSVTTPDPAKKNIAALTMVYQDHFFLDRWVRYYEDQIGRENIFILRHGHDPKIDEIGAGCNIIHVPNPASKVGFDNRRWYALSQLTSALTQCYNWVLCNDVDEIVAVDPDVCGSLSEYLAEKFANSDAPAILSPFAIELVHTPRFEPEPIEYDTKILSVRRNFRINTNYSKPCVTRRDVAYSGGGHGSNIHRVPLDPHLYLFHLRYVDDKISQERLEGRKDWIEKRRGKYEPGKRSKNSWDEGSDVFIELRQKIPMAETVNFDPVRNEMVSHLDHYGSGKWLYKNIRSTDIYRLPIRFSSLF